MPVFPDPVYTKPTTSEPAYRITSRYSNALRLLRHVPSPNDIIFSIRRLNLKHLDRAQAVASNPFTMLLCAPP